MDGRQDGGDVELLLREEVVVVSGAAGSVLVLFVSVWDCACGWMLRLGALFASLQSHQGHGQ